MQLSPVLRPTRSNIQSYMYQDSGVGIPTTQCDRRRWPGAGLRDTSKQKVAREDQGAQAALAAAALACGGDLEESVGALRRGVRWFWGARGEREAQLVTGWLRAVAARCCEPR
jgi:hypothetical protein